MGIERKRMRVNGSLFAAGAASVCVTVIHEDGFSDFAFSFWFVI